MPSAITTPETAPSATHRSTRQDNLPIPVRIIIDDDEKKAANDLEQKARDHDVSDLKAQWKAADAAAEGARYSEEQVEIARWQLGLSLAGAIGLFFSLCYTSRSLRQTKEAMRVTREVGEAQVRAYLGIDKIRFLPVNSRIEFHLKNFGQSIAKEVKVTTSCFLREDTQNSREVVLSVNGNDKFPKIDHDFGIVNPSHASPGLIVVDAVSNYERINVEVKIFYTDIFNRKWIQNGEYYRTADGSDKEGFNMHIVPNTSSESEIEEDRYQCRPAILHQLLGSVVHKAVKIR